MAVAVYISLTKHKTTKINLERVEVFTDLSKKQCAVMDWCIIIKKQNKYEKEF
uniref:Uncharacterized protein n=1 Tax=Siphoviridae sp. ctaLC6 TaxID=2826387 RepID=A0A8S5MQ93_9CAUD|nr:MAG TPA: hypothetical protein [Siphoviridae sp. ctaLC6]